MKNIHVLPTDKLSRLSDCHNNKLYLDDVRYLRNYQNIYITSDEEIKEGDWILFQNILTKALKGEKFSGTEKIILTTDQNLIKDGVQAIDDEFLEWFVKNPGCEFVEIKYQTTGLKDGIWQYDYKIIIPKEESKKYPIGGYAPGFYSCTCVTCNTKFTGDKRAVQCEPCAIKMVQEEPKQDETKHLLSTEANKKRLLEDVTKFPLTPDESYKQETLEEAAAIFSKQGSWQCPVSFTLGAKWQAERMYSEDELFNILLNYQSNYPYANNEIGLKKWFEQFKKK